MKRITHFFLLLILPVILVMACKSLTDAPALLPPQTPQEEIFYLIFPRSFYDSNGDRNGDLKGVMDKLDYIQSLGVTSIIMTPLSPSIYYHNYFVDDFKGIDAEYGTLKDYLNLIAAIHKRGMKFYMDTEWQYVTEHHPWFKESFGHPESRYTQYLFYHDSLNRDPESILYNMRYLRSYNGDSLQCTMINLKNPEVKQYMTDLYAYWMDPNHDGKFDDGVDGFRIDHMMDDLDHKGLLTNLFAEYWAPLFVQLKSINPKIKIIAEQADWNDPGLGYFTKAGIDIVYAFGLTFSILDKNQFEPRMDTLLRVVPQDKYQLLFLDNHDLDRFASMVHGDQNAMRSAATLLYFSKGIPYIYYGQELGMKGAMVIHGKNDGNDILRREAFEWNQDMNHAGMALWYKDSGPWWDSTYLKSNDGISVEEEEKDPNSLLNFYRHLLIARRSNPGLSIGDEVIIKNDNPAVLTYCRWHDDSKFLLAFNYSLDSVDVKVPLSSLPFPAKQEGNEVFQGDKVSHMAGAGETLDFSLKPEGYLVVKMK
jgi:alpha-amylase